MNLVLRGVAANPSTPEPLLLRLSERPGLAHALLGRDVLPPPVVDPEPAVRAALAGNPLVPEAVRAPLADDPDPEVRRRAALYRLPAEVLYRLVGDTGWNTRLLVCARYGDEVPLPARQAAVSNPALSAEELERISASASGGPS